MDKEQKETEEKIKTNTEESNEILSSIDNKFEKFNIVFSSIKSSIDAQTKVLQRTLDLQLDATEKSKRDELIEKVQDKDKSIGQTVKEDVKGMLGDAKGAFSLDGLLKGGLLLFMAPIVADFIKDFATTFFENMGIDGSFSDSVASALGAAGFWGSIGLIFGKRFGMLLGAGAFIEDFFNIGENINAMLKAIGVELNDETAEKIGLAIGVSLAAVLPLLLKKSLPLLLGKSGVLRGLLRSPAGAGGATPRSTPGQTPGAVPRQTPGGPVLDEAGRGSKYRDPSTGRFVKPPAAATPPAAGFGSKALDVGKNLFKNAGGVIRGNAVVGTALGALEAGSALMDESLTSSQKTQAVASAGGGAAGAIAGATLGSVVPVVGTIIGGALGYAAGSYLGGEAAGEASFDQSTVDRLKGIDPNSLNEEEYTKYISELAEQYKAAAVKEREFAGSEEGFTSEYRKNLLKEIDSLGLLLSSNGIDPKSIADISAMPATQDPISTFTEDYSFRRGTEGFQNFGDGTIAKLHGKEAVVPENTIAGEVLKSMFGKGWNSLDVTGLSSSVAKGIDYINNQSAQMVQNSKPTILAPVTNNNIYQGGNTSTNSSTVVLGSTGMDLDRPGYAK